MGEGKQTAWFPTLAATGHIPHLPPLRFDGLAECKGKNTTRIVFIWQEWEMEEARNMPMDFFGIIWWMRQYFSAASFLWWWNPLTGEFRLSAGNFLVAKLSPTESAGLCINETDEDAISTHTFPFSCIASDGSSPTFSPHD